MKTILAWEEGREDNYEKGEEGQGEEERRDCMECRGGWGIRMLRLFVSWRFDVFRKSVKIPTNQKV
jgi:hypothetical protein